MTVETLHELFEKLGNTFEFPRWCIEARPYVGPTDAAEYRVHITKSVCPTIKPTKGYFVKSVEATSTGLKLLDVANDCLTKLEELASNVTYTEVLE